MNKDQKDLLNVVVDYTYALDTLDNYDYERLTIDGTTTKEEPFHRKCDGSHQWLAREIWWLNSLW